MSSSIFATPLPQPKSSDVLEWAFPKPYHQYVLTGKSRAAWHTSFVIPQLNLLLDAGLLATSHRPKHIFLTHGHSDHTILTPAFVNREDPPDVFCPTLLNLGGLVTVEDASKEDFEPIGEDEVKDTFDGDVTAEKRRGREDSPDRSCPDWRHKPKRGQVHSDNRFLHTHETHGLRPGEVVPLERIKASDMSAEAFTCDHSIPCLGYVFRTTRQKLIPALRTTSQEDIKGLRESGASITAPQTKPVFAFLGDTTTAVLAAEPAWLREGVPVVITECSFLWEEHRAQAERTRHTLWSDLEPVVRKFPRTTFVLIHFSLRYEEHDIREFFSKMLDPPKNIVVWIGDDQD
ncbi:hypothetical protein PG994_008738 [Apiospora phragmitis]|uniref:Metallo-beta-lactamase domain-containing protein n=1 Tax=Apiospora phragmitis TaxID=2905665 RepID=A0ABR1UHB5_9PEZI